MWRSRIFWRLFGAYGILLTISFGTLGWLLIGRMENLWVTFWAAIGIGVLEQSAKFATGRGTLGDAIVFSIIMAAFLMQRRAKVTSVSLVIKS